MKLFDFGNGRGVSALAVFAGVVVMASGVSAAPYPSPEDYANIINDIRNSADQAILGVVNRPEAPFVTGLGKKPEPGECGAGFWTRGTGGYGDTDGNAFDINVDYYGAQAGVDFSCFDVNDAGLDYTLGIMGGGNTGVATLDGGIGHVDVDQMYAGVYGIVAVGDFVGDLQVRYDTTDFSSVGIALIDDGVAVTTERASISGSAKYRIDAGDGLSITPIAGFDVSQTAVSDLAINLDNASVSLDDLNTTIVYAGATLTKVFVLTDGNSIIAPSISANYYADISGDTDGSAQSDSGTVTFTIPGGDDLYEVGVGMLYSKVLEGDAKQVTASVKANYKWNDGLEAGNITAQLRLQY